MPERSLLSPILDWPRRRSLRYPTKTSTRSICIVKNWPARPQQAADPAQRPRTVRGVVALPRRRLIRGTQIPIARRGTPTRSHSRGFLPWRLSYAGPRSAPHRPSRAGIRNPTQSLPKYDVLVTSAFPPIATRSQTLRQVSNVPKAVIGAIHQICGPAHVKSRRAISIFDNNPLAPRVSATDRACIKYERASSRRLPRL